MNTQIFAGDVPIASWVTSLALFRKWAKSADYPDHGSCCYLNGIFWIDMSMERAAHSQIKSAINSVLAVIIKKEKLGFYFPDRMMLSNLNVDFATEPDGMFVSHQSLSSKRAKLESGNEAIEVLGTPDMVLEVISRTSTNKDTKLLRRLYWEAGIAEYWLIDSRTKDPTLEILRRGTTKYTAARSHDGWLKSKVFGKEFRLTYEQLQDITDFTLEIKD